MPKIKNVKIEFNTENAIFEETRDEISVILNKISMAFIAKEVYDGKKIRESNGNVIGKISLDTEETKKELIKKLAGEEIEWTREEYERSGLYLHNWLTNHEEEYVNQYKKVLIVFDEYIEYYINEENEPISKDEFECFSKEVLKKFYRYIKKEE